MSLAERPAVLKLRAADIPDDLVALLQAAGRAGDSAAFEVGRITNVLFQELDAEVKNLSRMSVYAAVGAWAGCAAETVRMRAHVEAHVPQWVRHKWDELYFHQFKALVPHCTTEAEWDNRIDAWLAYCAETGNKISSVDGIRRWLNSEKGAPSATNIYYRRFVVLGRKLYESEDLPENIYWPLADLLVRLDRLYRGHAKWDPEFAIPRAELPNTMP